MAFCRIEFRIIGRSGGGNAVKAAAYGSAGALASHKSAPANAVRMAAYRSGGCLEDSQGRVFDFSYKREEIWHSEVLTPDVAPAWAGNRLALWETVEAFEKRKDAQLFRECLLTLPRELTREQCIVLVRRFVTDQFVKRGMVADVNLHCPVAADGEPQPHAHVMLTLRRLGPDGFGQKAREWNDKALLRHWRAAWACAENEALHEAGSTERVDHRRLSAQREEALEQAEAARAMGQEHAAGRHERHAAALDRVPQKPRGISLSIEAMGKARERKARYQWATVRGRADRMMRGQGHGGELHGLLVRADEFLRGHAIDDPPRVRGEQPREVTPWRGWEHEHGR